MKILVVDDNEFNRQLLEMILGDHGYQSLSVCNGKEAIDSIETDPDIDLVLMDVNMPVMDGLEATKYIKENFPQRFVPIVFVTALDDQETLANCLSIGGDDFIPKPINEEVLTAKLKAHERTISFHRQLQENNAELAYHRRLMDREHNIVENIFNRCIGKHSLDYDNINHYISPMSQFNGDLLLVAPSPLGGIYVLLGDFTGHGLAAAIGCLPVSDIFYAMTTKKAGVGDIAREINNKLQDLLPDNMFFCAAIIELAQSGDSLTIWSGGMNDILVLGKDNKLNGKIQSQHMPLGILESYEFDSQTEIVKPFKGLRAYVYTDGIVEACNSDEELFGESRLETILTSGTGSRIERLMDVVKDFVGEEEQSDDIAIVEMFGEAFHQEKSEKNNTGEAEEYCVLPWKINLPLGIKELQNPSVVNQIIDVLKSIKGAGHHGDFLFTLFSELYSNALEHGLLDLDSSIKLEPDGFEQYYDMRQRRLDRLKSGEIRVELKIEPGPAAGNKSQLAKLYVSLTDTGKGFDYQMVKERIDDNDLAFARGVTLIESLCQELHYSNNGKTVSVVYPLSKS